MTDFPRPENFHSLHRHGFVRVGASTPRVRTADVAFNRDAILDEARRADEARVDLLVYPELCVSSYAIDDLHMQTALLDAVEDALAAIAAESADLAPVLLVGAPLRQDGQLYNCAIVISHGRILGVVPKSYLPNYREYYEKRWFSHGRNVRGRTMKLGGHEVPFGSDLIFEASDLPGFIFHVEICEDYWSAIPPSSDAALAGAAILTNLSASNITIGKSDERHMLCRSQSSRAMAAYAYSAAGPGESTTDLAWDGQGAIYELGDLLAESERFSLDPQLCLADIDTQRILNERMRSGTYADASEMRRTEFRRVAFDHRPHWQDAGLVRPIRRFPYVPNRRSHLDRDCYEAFNIQVEGLRRRFEATSGSRMVIGVSGGLDSTHALIVAAKVCDQLGLPRSTILGYTLPGFATGDTTKSNAWKLMRALGIEAAEIDIRPAAQQMLTDMNHPFAGGEPVYDVTFENVQAGLRTDYLFRLANQNSGFVIGTGDLSEMALGWCTYGVGDQMSHYAVNTGVPKTLIQYLVRWVIQTDQFDPETNDVLDAILQTKISPELVPQGEEEELQSTEDRIGPYELHDFFLFHTMRYGLPPSKVAFLAWHAWRDAETGSWPIDFPEAAKQEYDLPQIAEWLRVFVQRFFGFSQFKRSAMPNGPKVSPGGSLSPRGDWRAPSDATAQVWLDELERSLPD
ncbi:NAD+ synthase (glutamine-hydrolysing) [Palleronia marisminoris]|uniref:Glutamine-dependent NAD(+) synthetase n=1 Tax=Palleronia marisminoris TaxID=315423 RepID=A0A1Y5S5X9_9RHOB|nr:NAD(+) synthase [Palleronia marisminoris]SFG64315.1 NAD+ synthase (glutamine-hydrolysing) [Palleronia marisminoris]SLN33328.1 Glutamine-dependent NAD(+) synthetase [Palleronia marisminoris]